MDERMDVYPVKNFVAACRVDGCGWRQKHVTRTDATLDGEHHLAEWHATEAEEPPRIVDLMKALEASLAAVKRGRS